MIFLTACATESSSPENDKTERISLEVVDSLVLKTSQSSLFGSDDFDFFVSDEGLQQIAIFDAEELKIFLFNLDDGTLVRDIDIMTTGPNSIGPADSGTSLFNYKGSPMVWNNVTAVFNRLDWQGEVTGKFFFDQSRMEKDGVKPYLDYLRRPIIRGEEFVFTNVTMNPKSNDFTEVPAIQRFLLNGDSVLFDGNIVNLPDEYNIGFTGFAQFKYVPNIVSVNAGESYYVSFPLSHEVKVLRSNGSLEKSISVKSKYVDDFKPLRSIEYREKMFKREETPPPMEEIDAYDMTNSDYQALIKDEQSGIFIRIVNLRPEMEAFEKGDATPDFSLVFFKEGGEVLDEIYLSGDEYYLFMTFTTERGLHILNQRKTLDRDGELYFDIFEVKELGK